MDRRVRRIQKDIRMGWMFRTMMPVILIMAAVWLILYGMNETGRSGIIMLCLLMVLILAGLVGFITGSVKAHKVKKEINSHGNDFENDVFAKAGDRLSVGSNWLVYRNNEEWICWPRNEIVRITVRNHNAAGTRADIIIYPKSRMYGQTFHINATSYDWLKRLEEWPYAE